MERATECALRQPRRSARQVYGAGLDPIDPTKRTLARRAFFSDETIDQFVIDNQAQATFATGRIAHTMLFGVDYQYSLFDQISGDGVAPSIDMYAPIYGDLDFETGNYLGAS